MRKNCFLFLIFTVLNCCFCSDLIIHVTALKNDRKPVQFSLDGKIKELIIPQISTLQKEPFQHDFSKMAPAGEFTILHKLAMQKAIALSADGVWQNFIKETLLPTRKTRIFLGYDEHYLHLSAICDEPQMDKLMALPGKSGTDERAYVSECMDMIFFVNRNLPEYKQVVISAYGGIYAAKQLRNDENGRLQSDLTWQPVFPWKVSYSKDHWELHAALPLSEWGIPISEKSFVDLNIARQAIITKEFSSLGAVQNAFNEKNGLVRIWFGAKTPQEITLTGMTIPPGNPGKNTLRFSLQNSAQKQFRGKATMVSEQIPLKTFIREIELAPGSTENFELSWEASGSGLHKMLFQLLSAENQILDFSELRCDIPPPMKLHLDNCHLTYGSLPVPGRIELAIPKTVLQQSILQFSTGNITHCIKSPPENGFSFLLNTETIPPGNTVLKVDLLSENGKKLFSDQLPLIIASNPFDEE